MALKPADFIERSGFAGDLDQKDLEFLVVLTRRVHQLYNPGKPELSLEKCFENINLQGPEVVLEALREVH